MKKIVVSLLSFISVASYAQNTLKPSRQAFQSKWVQNDDYQMAWYMMRDTAKMEIGRVSTSIRKDKKQISVVTKVQMKNMKSEWVDSTMADVKTLEPIRHVSFNGQRDMVIQFGNIVTGYYTDKQKKTTRTISDTTQGGYFDSNIYPVLISWLPLESHYRQDIAIYDYTPASETRIKKAYVKDVTEGTCQTEKSGIREVWVVSVSDEIGDTNTISTYYFDKKDRKLWKQEIKTGGRRMMMKKIE